MTYYFPTLHNLVRIISVAQSQTRGDTTLTFLSIDCYTDGWVINLRVHHPDPRVFPLFDFHPSDTKMPLSARGRSVKRITSTTNSSGTGSESSAGCFRNERYEFSSFP